MAVVRSRFSATELLVAGEPNLRSVLVISEVAAGGLPNLRVEFNAVEVVMGGVPNLRDEQLVLEALTGGTPSLRSELVVVEVLQKVLEEFMSTEVFPVLKGLSFEVGKTPQFSNKLVEHTSGEETATSYWENPRWQFTLTYDYLPDRPVSVGETDLRTLMGFFLNRRGRFDTFLFEDPDDYLVTEEFQKDFDGSAVEFNLVRSMGGFIEPVGQLNTNYDLDVWLEVPETHTIPATPGPYTVTVDHAADITADEPVVNIGATVLTRVGGAPANGNQYSMTAGVFTFHSSRQNQSVDIRYRYLVNAADYTVTMPNVVAFDTAPADGSTAYASFHFYFVCRFVEDASEYTKFMDKLWNLNELSFRSLVA